jgi:hypothetical protein
VCALRTVAILVGVFVLLPFGATALITVGALDTPGSALGVEVVDGLAYVADRGSGLRIIDVTDPAAPVELGALDTPGSALGVEVVDGLAYVADYDSGLRIIDFGPEYHVVPEPSAVAILASGIAMLWLLKRRRMRT